MNTRLSPSHARVLLGVFALALVTFFYGSGFVSLFGPDEPRYAEVAREMWANSDYISPRLAGRLWLEKPVLLYWGQIVGYHLFGVNEFAARFPSAVWAFLTFLGLVGCSRRALGERASLYVGLVAASMLGLVIFAHAGSTDMGLSGTIGCALLCFWRATISHRRKVAWILAGAVFSAGSMLAKGLVGPLSLGIIWGIWSFWARPSRDTRPLLQRLVTYLGATVVFVAVCAIWYWPMWERHGQLFWQEFFVNHQFKRYTTNKYNHPQPVYFYIFIAMIGALPWTLWLFAEAKRIRRLRPRTDQGDGFLALAWVWALFPIAFFSLSDSKLPSYILPSFPALAILAAHSLSQGEWLPRGWKPKWVAAGGASFIAAVVFIAFTIYGPKEANSLSYRPLCRTIAAALHPGEITTTFRLGKTYEPVFYLEGRVVPGNGEHDTFVAEEPGDLLPLLAKGSMVVFVGTEDSQLIEKDPHFKADLLAQQKKIRAYRLTLR